MTVMFIQQFIKNLHLRIMRRNRQKGLYIQLIDWHPVEGVPVVLSFPPRRCLEKEVE